MDRSIVYPGAIPLDTDILGLNRNVLVAIGALTAAVFGKGTVVDGLGCLPTSPASMTVTVGAGSITQYSALDATAFGSLPADTSDQIVKTGINLQATSFTLPAPETSGQSINYLIEAAFAEADADPAVLPYVNAANPGLPFSGPGNTGAPQNTLRAERVQLQLKPGAAAPAGTQTTPGVDTGWVGLYVITVNYGQTAITAAAITTLPEAPFVPFKLPALRPGFSNMQVFTASGAFTVPPGVSAVKATVIGAGGAAGYHATIPGGGGGAGGRTSGIIAGLTPGQAIAVTVGAGGVAPAAPASGNPGGTSSFGAFMSAIGGAGGEGGTGTIFANAGGIGGTGMGGQINISGSDGGDCIAVAQRGGDGGGPGNGRGASGPAAGFTAQGFCVGGGGGGSTAASGGTGIAGGAGAPGVVIVEF